MAVQQAESESAPLTTPGDLEDRVRERIEGTADSWIDAIKELAEEYDQQYNQG
jgi:hypothetical protein